MNLEQTIHAAIQQVADSRGIDLPPLQATHTLTGDLGLRSLDLAHLVAVLEAELHADPFARLVPITSVRTVGDLCAAYHRCLAPPAETEPQPGRAEGLARASARREAAARRQSR
jgi:hypothetical protein